MLSREPSLTPAQIRTRLRLTADRISGVCFDEASGWGRLNAYRALTETATKNSTAAAVQQYRDLRTKYYGGQSYDFSEPALVAMATPLINANKPDDAIALLQLNAEFYPKSSATYAALGQAYARKNDTANAVKSYEKAVELDPNNQIAKRQLEQLKAK